MSVLEGVLTYLRDIPGLEALAVDGLGAAHGNMSLRPVPVEPVRKEYLDGSTLRQEMYYLWVRRGSGGGDDARQEDLQWLSALSETLENNTRRGDLPDLGTGKRAWSFRAVETPATEILQENGLLVDQITLRLEYFMEG